MTGHKLMFDFEIKTHPWIPKNLAIATNRYGNILGVIDLESNWVKWKRLLNMGPEGFE